MLRSKTQTVNLFFRLLERVQTEFSGAKINKLNFVDIRETVSEADVLCHAQRRYEDTHTLKASGPERITHT